MKKILSLIFFSPLLFSIHSLTAEGVGGRIEIGVSPIRYEARVNPGEKKEDSITFTNTSPNPYTFILTTEDCIQINTVGTPECRPQIAGKKDPIKLSSWIEILGPQTITVAPGEEKKIPFKVVAPAGAAPGGHYGGVFFNPQITNQAQTVGVIRRIGVLFLVEVSGDIHIDTNIGEIKMTSGKQSGENGGGSSSVSSFWTSLITDPTPEKWTQAGKVIVSELDPLDTTPPLTVAPPKPTEEGSEKSFQMEFSIPMSNSGNTHIKPTGKIIIKDESGNQLTSIGRETIKTPEGAVAGDRVVDYLPINDEEGNLLPGMSREFQAEWLGFPYQTVGKDGQPVLEYRSPSEYFSAANAIQYLYPWQRLRLIDQHRSMTAEIELEYPKTDGGKEIIKKTLPITVSYTETVVGVHYGQILLSILLVGFIGAFFRRRKKFLIEDTDESIDNEVLSQDIDLEETHPVRKRADLDRRRISQENRPPVGVRTRRAKKNEENGKR